MLSILNMILDEINNLTDMMKGPVEIFNSNSSEIPAYDFGPEYHRTFRIYSLSIMFIVSLIGNSLVVWQLTPRGRERFPKSKVLFLNLAAADLFVTFAGMLSQLIWELMDHEWIAGDVGCKTFKFSQTYSLSSSTYILVAIALDRYNAIVRPFSSSSDPQVYAIISWLLALFPALPCFFVFHEVQITETSSKCVSKFYTSPQSSFWRQAYVVCVFVFVFILPFILLLMLYIRIAVEIHTRSLFTPNQQTVSNLPRARTKTLKITSAILLTFLVVNSPYVVQEGLVSFGYADVINKNISALAGIISASNSALNPYIYLIFQSTKPSIRDFFTNIASVIRSRQWSTSSHRKETSFVSASSKTSTHINLANMVSDTKETKVSALINQKKEVEATFV